MYEICSGIGNAMRAVKKRIPILIREMTTIGACDDEGGEDGMRARFCLLLWKNPARAVLAYPYHIITRPIHRLLITSIGCIQVIYL
jgi:hypothetical protein